MLPGIVRRLLGPGVLLVVAGLALAQSPPATAPATVDESQETPAATPAEPATTGDASNEPTPAGAAENEPTPAGAS